MICTVINALIDTYLIEKDIYLFQMMKQLPKHVTNRQLVDRV